MGIRTFAVAALLATSALVSVAPGGAPMGPPAAYLGEGKWAVSGEYGYEQLDMTAFGTVTEQFLAGSTHAWNTGFRVDDLKSNMGFGTLAIGLSENWDIFARVGASNGQDKLVVVPNDTGALEAQDSFDGSFGLAWGAGTRATFFRSGPWSFGGLFQITWFHPGDSDFGVTDPEAPDESWAGNVSLKYWETQASLAVAYQTQGWRLWAGPFVQFIRGDMDFSGGGSVDGVGISTIRWTSKLQEVSQVGGHFGVQWEASDQFHLWVEGQITGDSWLAGIGVVLIPGKGEEQL